MFWNRGGETRFLVRFQDNWLVVTSSERLGDEQFELAATSLFVVERFFFGNFGEDIRSGRRIDGRRPPRLAQPRTAADVYDGFRIGRINFGGRSHLGLNDPAGKTIAVAAGDELTGTMRLAELSLYVNSKVSEIKESFQSPDGQPLFTLKSEQNRDGAQPPPNARDVAELVALIADDPYVNGVAEDARAHRRASPRTDPPPIRRDETWDRYLYFFYVGQGLTESSGFRYTSRRPIPFGVAERTQKRLEEVLKRIRDAGNLPLAQRWNAAAIVYDRTPGNGDAYFFYGDDAENWHLTPGNLDRIAAQGLALSPNDTR